MIENLNMNYAHKMQRCNKYIEALEEEHRKIQVFQLELPLCLELLTQAIEAFKREISGTTTECVLVQSECSEHTTGECGPVLEEFIPIKRSSSCDEDDEHESHGHDPRNNDDKISSNNTYNNKKSDWLRSVQLWNQSPDPLPKEERVPEKQTAVDVKRNSGAFQLLHQEKSLSKSDCNENRKLAAASAEAASSTAGGGGKEDSEKRGQRKQRRCWSPEWHRRFLNGLQQLGGSRVETPKQNRELMKVDGLTNDEVKSHLQKYRLHTKRPGRAVPNNENPHAPAHFVVMGGIWVPQPDYPARPSNGIYTTVTGRPPPAPQQWPS